jgi:hypothetical protein
MTSNQSYDVTDEALERCLNSGGFGGKRGITQPVSDSVVVAARSIVIAAKIGDRVAQWRAEDAKVRHAGGRPSSIDDNAIVTLLVLLALEGSPLFVTNIANAIEHRLSDEAKSLLGIRHYAADGDDWYDRSWRAVHRLLSVIDPYPVPHNKRISVEEFKTIEAKRDPNEVQRRKDRLNEFSNGLVLATWQMIPRDIRRRWKGNVCVDATPVKAFARGYSPRTPFTSEPDAGWYVREGDHRDTGDKKRRVHSKYLFGWEATIVIASTNDPRSPADFPLLATGMAFDKPGFSVAENAMMVFHSMRENGMPVGLAVGDRAYWPLAQAEKLQLPMRALGYSNVNDYQDIQLGVQAGHGGGIMVEGAWYCPSMPTPLVEATIDYRVKKTIDEVMWKKRIAARTPYMLHSKEAPDSDGYQPLRCPAVGASATVACPLRPESMKGDKVVLRSRVATPPEHVDRICRQTSVSFAPSAGAKYRQDIQYGTDEWHEMFATARNTIEGFNGFIKDGAHEALADPTRRRLRGRAAQHLLTALLVMAANVRKIRAFMDGLRATPKEKQRKAQRRQNRKRESITDFLPVMAKPPDDEGVIAS